MSRDVYRLAWAFVVLDAGLVALTLIWLLIPAPTWLTAGGIGLFAAVAAVEMFLMARWGALCERAAALRATVGRWTLTRGELTVGGWLWLADPADAQHFAHRLTVALTEADETAEVTREESSE